MNANASIIRSKLALPVLLCTGFLFATVARQGRPESPKSAESAGATLFRDKGCAYCHGADLRGTPKGPSLANVRKTMKPAQIADQIKNGGQKMPSFDDSLSSDEVAQLVAYLRAKHRPQPAPQPIPPPAASDRN